ncbi:MAG: prephenate dehydrogenase/arogenate dehydrogenase family protein [bacterium]|nr:prephenate dehydrogenase/arogenate dehydrogenase family protein [bacterium]
MKIEIQGLGIIGASIAMALKKNTKCKVYGYDIDKNTLNYAVSKGIIDGCKKSFKADYVFICLPIDIVVDVINSIDSVDSIIFHTTSLQKFVFDEVKNKKLKLLGFHPLGGSEKSGIQNADIRYITQSNSILVVDSRFKITQDIIQAALNLLKKISLNVIQTDPNTHDKILAYTSHMLHLISYALIKAPFSVDGFTGRAFSDFTRITKSNKDMWRFIFKKNKKNIYRSWGYFKTIVDGFFKSEFKNI